MGMLDRARNETALLWVGSRALPSFVNIGSGSGAFLVAQSGLVADLNLGRTFTSVGSSVNKEITYTADWGATTLSGLQVREFGAGIGSSGNSIWNREPVSAVTFDGTNELQIQITYQTF